MTQYLLKVSFCVGPISSVLLQQLQRLKEEWIILLSRGVREWVKNGHCSHSEIPFCEIGNSGEKDQVKRRKRGDGLKEQNSLPEITL